MFVDDTIAWNMVEVEDLWAFDKLLLSKRLGYICGPKGVRVPKPGYYIVRPCINLLGMGLGSQIQYIHSSTDYIPDGFFWCEIFKGRHLSIDFINNEEFLCVEGIKHPSKNNRWLEWRKVDCEYSIPLDINLLLEKYPVMNIEMINNNIIEVHFRLNSDFSKHTSDYVKPVYLDDTIQPDKHETFIHRPDSDRLGFYIQKDSLD